MAELIAGLVEALVALFGLFFEALIYVLSVSITIIAYLVSPKFRAQKQQEWKATPVRKYLDVATSTICVAAIVAFSVWVIWPEKKEPGTVDNFSLEKGEVGEDVRVVIRTDLTNHYRFAVKQGGVSNILGTKTLSELSNALRQNLKALDRKPGGTNTQTQLAK